MSLSQWLCMAIFILSALGVGVFRKSWAPRAAHADLCEIRSAPALLCGQKIALKNARVGELALIDGISLKGARRIVSFVAQNAAEILSVEDLVRVKGIGEKTIEKLKIYFY